MQKSNKFGDFWMVPKIKDCPELSLEARMILGMFRTFENGENKAWPSQKRLAEEIGCSIRTVQRHLESLRQAGYLEWEKQGFHKSNIYTIPNTTKCRIKTRQNVVSKGDTSVVSKGDTSVVSIPIYKNNTHKNIDTPHTPQGGDRGFEEFWESFPKKVAKEKAARAWKKLKPDASLCSRILLHVAVMRKDPSWIRDSGQFIPHPTTYLNQKRWEDISENLEGDRFSHLFTPEKYQEMEKERDDIMKLYLE